MLALASAGGASRATEGGPGAVSALLSPARAFAEGERDRWFYWLPVALGSGIWIYFALPFEPSGALAGAALAVAVALRALGSRTTLRGLLSAALLAAALGFAMAKAQTERVRAPVLERTLHNVAVEGRVELVEASATRAQRLTLRPRSIGDLAPDKIPRRVRVRALTPIEGVTPGDWVRLRATLAPPAGPALPGGYDFARQAWFMHLGAVGFALARGELLTGAPAAEGWLALRARIEALRQAIGERISAALPGETGAIARALVTGERGAIPDTVSDAYRDSGLFHLLSISGLHMSIMAGAVFVSVRFLLALFPALALRHPTKKWAAAAAAVAALGYLAISGAEFATVRAYVMISIMFLAVLLDRPALALRNVAATALLILLVSPESLLDVGFQMSFAAVVALVAAYEAVRAAAARRGFVPGTLLKLALFFGGIVLSTLVASFAVAPLAAYHFHKSQQFAVLANLIAIPICNLVVMPAALATLVLMPFGWEAAPLWVMALGVEATSACARWVAALPGAVGLVPQMPDAAFAAMAGGGLWLCLVRHRVRLAGLALVAVGLALTPLISRPDVLIGHDARLVAVRGASGAFSALGTMQSAFELSRWLEHDGDERAARDALTGAANDFRCDGAGCVASPAGRTLAVARRPAALADDCAKAVVLVVPTPRPRHCEGPRHVVDINAVREDGTHAIYFDADGGIRVETVRAARGDRPWVPPRREAGPVTAAGGGEGLPGRGEGAEARRVGSFAAPGLARALGRSRREIEDEEMGGSGIGSLPPDPAEE